MKSASSPHQIGFIDRARQELRLPPREGINLITEDIHKLAEALKHLSLGAEIEVKPAVQDQVFVDTAMGVAFVEPYVPCSIRVLQDCFDPEAQLRQSVHWQNLSPLHGDVLVHEIPEFRSTAIGGAIAHYLGELARAGWRGTLGAQEVVYSELPTVFIGNAAPRTREPQQGGAPFIFARLGFNIFYFGTNSDELGCLKPFLIGNPREVIIDECSTYRSRFLGKRVAEWRSGDLSNFGKELSAQSITPAPYGAVLFVDNFGNVKLNITGRELQNYTGPLNELSSSKPVRLAIKFPNGKVLMAQAVRKLEDGKNGSLLLAVGSSRANLGRDDLDNSVDCYLKGNPDGNSAAQMFLDALGTRVAGGTPRHLLPVPGNVISLEKAPYHISDNQIGILVSLLG